MWTGPFLDRTGDERSGSCIPETRNLARAGLRDCGPMWLPGFEPAGLVGLDIGATLRGRGHRGLFLARSAMAVGA